MKLSHFAASVVIAVLALSLPATAGTASNTIQSTAQIVPGTTVSVYLINGSVVTATRADGAVDAMRAVPGVTLTAVSFESQPSWRVVKRVTFDKSRHLLTIDF